MFTTSFYCLVFFGFPSISPSEPSYSSSEISNSSSFSRAYLSFAASSFYLYSFDLLALSINLSPVSCKLSSYYSSIPIYSSRSFRACSLNCINTDLHSRRHTLPTCPSAFHRSTFPAALCGSCSASLSHFELRFYLQTSSCLECVCFLSCASEKYAPGFVCYGASPSRTTALQDLESRI